ncbi:hypothetical protein [Amycolatopsis orientalis]|uniref:hypothetical protein n=1 Tax=Amycolatopsis orientalis TaxID=31958 RepID=UPI0006872251|nr:hypothetical protein [Amycolatopsis orientalis]
METCPAIALGSKPTRARTSHSTVVRQVNVRHTPIATTAATVRTQSHALGSSMASTRTASFARCIASETGRPDASAASNGTSTAAASAQTTAAPAAVRVAA